MKYLSVCSGIEAASVAWQPLGWSPVAFAEIEAFPSAVLAHHYPDVPNWGDITNCQEWPDANVDVLCGGTPCQSFSVAGLRKGLDDPRGNLMLTYLAIARRYRPRWLVWENVPGVLSSNGGRDFGTFLGGLAKLGYGFAYRVLDAQYFGVAQRRRRVFVVGCLGDWRSAAAVLFEPESLRGDPAPSREAGQGFAADVAPGLTASGRGVERCGESRGQDPVIAAPVASTLNAHFGDKMGLENQHVNEGCPLFVAHTLRSRHDSSEDGTGRGTPLVTTLAIRGRNGEPHLETRDDGTANAILTPNGGRGGIGVGAVAFQNRQDPDISGSVTHPLGAKDNGMAVAFTVSKNSGGFAWEKPVTPAIDATAGKLPNQQYGIRSGMSVRRLTPTECERLQGFPDGYTRIPWRNKPAEKCPDGPRYKALGNSWAVPCARWIGERIELLESALEEAA